jgi:hypothetical protein
MNTKIKIPIIAEILTPDTIAECRVSFSTPEGKSLYRKLWSFVEDYPDQRSPEEMESPDALMNNNLAQFWDRLSIDEQKMIVAIDAEDDDDGGQ